MITSTFCLRKSMMSAFLLCLILAAGCNRIQQGPGKTTDHFALESGFKNPPDSVKPWIYWFWMSDNISKEGITKDLETMANLDIGEALIGNVGLADVPYGNVRVLSENWWNMVEHAIREGQRLGVDIGMFNCPGWSQSGGPWVKPTEAMRYLVSRETRIEGGKRIRTILPRPDGLYQDVRVIAYLVPKDDELSIAAEHPKITTNPDLSNKQMLVDGNPESVCLFREAGKSKSIIIDMETAGLFCARSLVIYPSRTHLACDMDLQVPEDGIYKSIKKFRFDRSNSSVNVGPQPFGPVAVSLRETTSKKFRLIMDNFDMSNFLDVEGKRVSDAGLAEIELMSAPRLGSYIEKQLGKMHQTPFPLWKEYQWKSQSESGSKDMRIDPDKVLDLTGQMDKDGTLNWDAPEGIWTVMRIGLMPTGTRNSPAAPYATGWEVDKMNTVYLKHHYDAFIGDLLRRMPARDRTALKHVVMDSYEQGSENWTEGFDQEFKDKYGYDPFPWMPVLTGRIVGSADQSDRFLWDMRRLIADLIAYKYVGGLRDMAQKDGLKVWLENYGHWGFPSEFLMYGGQSPEIGGEFWNEGELGNIECRAASSAAHIYGKQKVYAESYTAAGLHFQRYPGLLKKRGDWSYTEGINHVVLSVDISQPWDEKVPGLNAAFGTELNRNNTWFGRSKAWIDYQRRCMFMLQQGKVVNDVCYFIGEDVPKMTGIRNPEIPDGYSYDYINAEVIMTLARVKEGRIVLPDGMSYSLLVLPPLETIRPELLGKIRELVEQGANILGPPPSASPSLQNYPEADSKVKELASVLWGRADGKQEQFRKVGKGMVMSGVDTRTALTRINVTEDFKLPAKAPVLYIHRRIGDMDIYFITNQGDKHLEISPSFRTKGKRPVLWDAVSGNIRQLPQFSESDGRTTVPLIMEAGQSFFIVFGRPAAVIKPADGQVNFPVADTIIRVKGPWQTIFDKRKRGPVQPVLFEKLADWSASNEESIRYYSGTAVYRISFDLQDIGKERNLMLDLGNVKIMARVKLNGKELGTVWTNPWQLDITAAAKTGKNELEVEVLNLWVNRLIGDSRLPEKERGTWAPNNPYRPGDRLEPSGLLGPVTVLSFAFSAAEN
jgi:hypothetical protein